MNERALLYVPGDQPDKLSRALERGADGIIVDLEDAVAEPAKDRARAAVAAWLAGRARGAATIWVRVNSGRRRDGDVRAVAVHPALTGIYVAKAESAAELTDLDGQLTQLGSAAAVVPLLESASAVLNARSIAAAPRVRRLQVGEADLAAELGLHPGPDERELWWVRSQVVLASAAAGVDAPIGPVSTDFRDLDQLRASSVALRRFGFGGRACIHPAQLPVVLDAFTPSAREVQLAQDVVRRAEASDDGATVGADGRMIDAAVIRQARRTLAYADDADE